MSSTVSWEASTARADISLEAEVVHLADGYNRDKEVAIAPTDYQAVYAYGEYVNPYLSDTIGSTTAFGAARTNRGWSFSGGGDVAAWGPSGGGVAGGTIFFDEYVNIEFPNANVAVQYDSLTVVATVLGTIRAYGNMTTYFQQNPHLIDLYGTTTNAHSAVYFSYFDQQVASYWAGGWVDGHGRPIPAPNSEPAVFAEIFTLSSPAGETPAPEVRTFHLWGNLLVNALAFDSGTLTATELQSASAFGGLIIDAILLPDAGGNLVTPESLGFIVTTQSGRRSPNAIPDAWEAGDFNYNGIVDADDFLSWQRGHSLHPLSGQDLGNWAETFGLSASPAAATSLVVPEPPTWGLLAVFLLCARRNMRG